MHNTDYLFVIVAKLKEEKKSLKAEEAELQQKLAALQTKVKEVVRKTKPLSAQLKALQKGEANPQAKPKSTKHKGKHSTQQRLNNSA